MLLRETPTIPPGRYRLRNKAEIVVLHVAQDAVGVRHLVYHLLMTPEAVKTAPVNDMIGEIARVGEVSPIADFLGHPSAQRSLAA